MEMGARENPMWDAPQHSPNQAQWKHVETCGSIDKRHVPRDYGHLCLCRFQPTQLKKVSFINIITHAHVDCYAMYITVCIFYFCSLAGFKNKPHDGVLLCASLLNPAWMRTASILWRRRHAFHFNNTYVHLLWQRHTVDDDVFSSKNTEVIYDLTKKIRIYLQN
jgi:hypothetical protein